MLETMVLEAGYGNIQVLWGTSIDVREGEIVGLLGPNGAGKSTLLNCIAGLVPARGGEIKWDSINLTGSPPHQRVALGLSLVLERRRLFPLMTVHDNLLVGSYPPKARKRRQETLDSVLTLFPALQNKLHTRAQYLSGGEQQMAAIARGLMSRPRLLMVDEPYLGLAPGVVEKVNGVFKQLSKEGLSILFIEQHLELAIETAHRLYVLIDGRVALSESCESAGLRDRIQDQYFGTTVPLLAGPKS